MRGAAFPVIAASLIALTEAFWQSQSQLLVVLDTYPIPYTKASWIKALREFGETTSFPHKISLWCPQGSTWMISKSQSGWR